MLKYLFSVLFQFLVLSVVNAGQYDDGGPLEIKLVNSSKETNIIDIIDGLCLPVDGKHDSEEYLTTVRCEFTRAVVYKSPYVEKLSQWVKKENFFPPMEEQKRLLKELCANLEKDTTALNTKESLARKRDDIARLDKICNIRILFKSWYLTNIWWCHIVFIGIIILIIIF